MDILKYKDYEGTAELDMVRRVCRGKILFIDDLVTYEAASPQDLQREFEAAVNDYLETCKELGRKPQKALKGQFNVRISPELHRAAVLQATRDGVSLNDVVTRAIDAFVKVRAAAINHNVQVTLTVHQGEAVKTLTSNPAIGQQWERVANANVQH